MARLEMLATLALRSVLEQVVPGYGHRTGDTVQIDYGATMGLRDRIRAGARADVALLTAGAIAELEREGILLSGSQADLARSDIGVAVKEGAAQPDISTVEAFKAALLRASSVAYSDIGASGIYFKGLLQRLGIAEQVNAKAWILPPGFTAEPVARGEVELAVQQLSELMQVPGVKIIGKLPPAIQQFTVFSAGVFARTEDREAAAGLIGFLRSPEVATVLASHGLEPVNSSA